MKIVFAGTPKFSEYVLQTLINSKHDVIAVYTQPDRPAGRGRKLTASPVKNLALEYDIQVLQPLSLRDEAAQLELDNLQADVMIVVAYGLLLPQAVLDMPKFGCLNIHASILPRWRGAAPIQRAIESGDIQTGVTIMQMNAGLDTGDMLNIVTTPITSVDTTETIHDTLQTIGSDALITTLLQIENNSLQPVIQDDTQANYAQKISKAEAKIDWNLTADVLSKKIRAFNPWPMCFTPFKKGNLRIITVEVINSAHNESCGTILAVTKQGFEVACGTGVLLVKRCQPAGKKALDAYDFAVSRQLQGYKFE